MTIIREFVDVESAKMGGRAGFNEMVAFLKKHHATCRTILVEKTDRLAGNNLFTPALPLVRALLAM